MVYVAFLKLSSCNRLTKLAPNVIDNVTVMSSTLLVAFMLVQANQTSSLDNATLCVYTQH